MTTGLPTPAVGPTDPVAIPARDLSTKRFARRQALRLLARRPEFLIGATVLGICLVCAVGGAALAPHDPYAAAGIGHAPPGTEGYLLGTDRLGRDVLSRVILRAGAVLVVAAL